VGFAELPGIEKVGGARALTSAIILSGMGTVAYFQSTMTALLVEGAIGQAWRRKRMRNSIEALSEHIVVAGVGSTGQHVVEELQSAAKPFVVIDRDLAQLTRLSEEVAGGKLLFINGDATEDEVLKSAGVERAFGVIATLSDDKDNLFVTLSARSMNPKARIVARVIGPDAAAKMARAGADVTVSPNMIGGRRMAGEMLRPAVTEFLDGMLRDREENLRVEEVTVPEQSSLVGHPLRDAPIRREMNVLVLAVRGRDRRFAYNPGPDHVLEAGTVLVVLGAFRDIQRMRKRMGAGA
jgi:voltage-gated potassium channel